jgi:hypothetical protein
VVALLLQSGGPVVGASFTRTANTAAGRSLYEIGGRLTGSDGSAVLAETT